MTDVPSLLPPGAGRERDLPRWVLPVALLGLVVLFASALPALLAKRRLDRRGHEIEEQVRATGRRIDETRRETTAIEADSFVRERTLEALLRAGRDPVAKPR